MKLGCITNYVSEMADHRPVTCCAFTRDGSEIVTGGWTGAVTVWSVQPLRKITKFTGHEERITGIATNPNLSLATEEGPAIATGSADCCARIWTSKGKLLAALDDHHERLGRVAFHPSGRLLATACFDQTWRIWDLEKNKSILSKCSHSTMKSNLIYEQEGHSRPVYSVAFHCDGSLLASGGLDGVGKVWDLRTGRRIMTLVGHTKAILALDFSPNGYNLITGSLDNSCQVWDLRQVACCYTIAAHRKLIADVRYQPEIGAYFVTASYDHEARVWSANDFRLTRTLSGHDSKVMSVDIHPDIHQNLIATVGYDRSVKFWKK